MPSKNPITTTNTVLFQIIAGWNSLNGTFIKGERLTVNLVKHEDTRYCRDNVWFTVEVTNAGGKVVNRILKTCATRKTALGWAQGNFGHQKAA